MLAVGGFGPDGVIMENISEQDLVEHCVIVEPSGGPGIPMSHEDHDHDHDGHTVSIGDCESVVVTSVSPEPPQVTSTGTRIVYRHSSLHHRLVSHGGQLVTVLTHAPSQHHHHQQHHHHHQQHHHHHHQQHHHHHLDDEEVVEEELVEDDGSGVIVEASDECQESSTAGILSGTTGGDGTLLGTEELVVACGSNNSSRTGSSVGVIGGGGGNTGSTGSDHRLVVVTSLPTSAPHTLTLHRIQLKSPNLALAAAATAGDHPTVLVTQQTHQQQESPGGGQTTAEDLSLSNHHQQQNQHHHHQHQHQHQHHHHHHPHHHKVNVLTDSHGGQTTLTVIVPPQPDCGEVDDTDDPELGTNTHSGGCGSTSQHNQQQHPDHEEDVEDEQEVEEQVLSSPNLSPSSGIGGMIDAAEFRALQGGGGSSHHHGHHHSNSSGQSGGSVHHSQHHHHHHQEHGGYQSLNGRLSPAGYSPSGASSGQYATLTPLQPLPPISTMTDKFSYGHGSNVGGGFSVMQHNGLANLGLGVNYSGNYEKLPMEMSPPHHYSSPTNGLGGMSLPSHQSSSPPSISPHHYSQNGLSPKPLSPNNGYESSYGNNNGRGGHRGGSPSNSPPSSLHHSSPSPHGGQQQHVTFATGVSLTSNGLSPHSTSHSSPPLTGATAIVVTHRDASSPPSSSPLSVVMTCGGTGVHPHIAHTQQGGGSGVTTLVGTHLTLKSSSGSGSGGGNGIATNNGSANNSVTTPAGSGGSTASSTTSSSGGGGGELEEINTKELAARISAELKRYSIPQAIFAQRVLCRSQGTLSDLLRNPKPWSKLKSGRETFRRMWKWLQEPEFQRMSALRLAGKQSSSSCGYTATASSGGTTASSGSACGMMGPPGSSPSSSSSFVSQAHELHPPHPFDVDNFYPGPHTACKRKEEQQTQPEHPPAPKKPRLVFTDLQRRTLQAIFKETKRPSKEMQVTIARQLGLEPTTVGNFFMNARRRSMDKWKEENDTSPPGSKGQQGSNNNNNNNNNNSTNASSTTASSNGQQQQQQQQLAQHLGSVHVAQVVTVHHTGLSGGGGQDDGEGL